MNRTRRHMAAAAIAALALLLAAGGAGAFINPGFTPKDILENAQAALVLEFKSLDANSGLAIATVTEVLGYRDANLVPRDRSTAPKELKIDLMAMGEQMGAQGRMMMDKITSGNKQAIFFYGAFDPGGTEGGDQEVVQLGQTAAFLQFTNKWMILSESNAAPGIWGMEKIWSHLNGTWAGSTDMFLRILHNLVEDPLFHVPCDEEVDWDGNGITRFGRISGKVFAALPVDVAGDGTAALFLAAEAGDRLYRWDGNGLADVTARAALASKSQVAAWGDFDGDGKLDLASWDGKGLSIVSQKADGTFAAPKDAGVGGALKDGCLSLSMLDVGTGAKAGLLVGTKGWPVLLVPKDGGGFEARPLGTGEFAGKELKGPGPCLAADLDGDGFIEVVQIFSDGALLYKGTGRGAFAAAVRAPLAAGNTQYGVCLADFDSDGLQEIFVAGDARSRLFQNLGGLRFVDMLDYSGSLEYISKPGGILAWSGDINNDSKQDVLIAYGTRMAPQLFFNRGFRAFGLCRERLDLVEQRGEFEPLDPTLVPEAQSGQQTACLGDFNGDGALDMVLVLTGVADMPKEGQGQGKPIAAGATLYWDAAQRVVTDVKEGNGAAVGKAEKAALAADTGVPVLVAGGNLVFFPIRVTKESPAYAARVNLPLGGPTPGPVNVWASIGKRLVGSWVLRAGDPPALIGTYRGQKAVTLKALGPDGKPLPEKKVKVMDGPAGASLGKE